jgi:peptidoglycan/xylan/chitin deacetylase (PgdA/CDA1 family)
MSTELIVRKLNKKKVAGAIIILAVLILLIINSIVLQIRKKSNESYVNDVFSSQNFEKQVGKEMVDEEIDYGYLYKAKYPSTNTIELNMKINLKEQEIKNRFIKNYKKSFKQKLSGDIFYDAVDYYSFQGDNGTMSVIFVENIFDKGNVCIEKNVYHENFSFDDKDTLKDTYIFNGDYKSTLKDILIADIKRVENTGYFKENYEEVIRNENYEVKYALTKDYIKFIFSNDGVSNLEKDYVLLDIPYQDFESIMTFKPGEEKHYGTVYEPVGTKMYIKETANFYVRDTKNSNLERIINRGEEVEAVSKGENDFYLIKDKNGKSGYVLSKYISTDIIASEGFSEEYATYFAVRNTKVLKEASLESEAISDVSEGAEVKILGKNEGGITEVIYNNEKAYIKSADISKVKVTRKDNILIRELDPNRPMVALTFDDGPNPTTSKRIVDALIMYDQRATFFDLGMLVRRYPDTVRYESEAGMECESHTYDHKNLNKLNADEITWQIIESENAHREVLGRKPDLIRPPYGNANQLVKDVFCGYPLINWDIDTLDWKTKSSEKIMEEIRRHESLDGKVILMHSIYDSTAEAVEIMVPELVSQGYQLVTVSELAAYKGVDLNNSVVYWGLYNQK